MKAIQLFKRFGIRIERVNPRLSAIVLCAQIAISCLVPWIGSLYAHGNTSRETHPISPVTPSHINLDAVMNRAVSIKMK